MTFSRTVLDVASKLYSGPIEHLCTRVGIDRSLRAMYDRLESITTPNSTELTIGPASVTFSTASITEYRRVTEYVERDILADLLSELREDDLFWDVGANTGIYACMAADILSTGSVFAFEPHPGNVTSLRTNLQRNDLRNVTVEECALGDVEGTTSLNITAEDAGLGLHSLQAEDQTGIEVPIRTGDGYVDTTARVPNVVKIDVEGAEADVLKGMRSTLADSNCRIVYCEIHADESHPNSIRKYGHEPDDVEQLLRDAGFRVNTIDGGPTYTVKATRER